MSNLKKGSTVGGFAIVSEADENQHVHDVSDIDGLGDGATAETGPGSGFDADTLNGLHYSDMVQNFVNKAGDTIIRNVSITDEPSTDLSAVSRKYTLDYFESNVVLDSPSIPFVSISPSCTLTYDGGNNTINFSSGDILIGGSYYTFNSLSISITPPSSSERYVYVSLNNGNIELEVETDYIEHDYYKILVGSISFGSSSQVLSVNQRPVMCNLHGVSMNEQSTPYSMILSDSSGNVDSNWFSLTSTGSADTINLKGSKTIVSGGSESYTITDYDQYSTYSAVSDIGSISIAGDVITVNAPVVSQVSSLVIYVTRNSNTLPFVIEVTP